MLLYAEESATPDAGKGSTQLTVLSSMNEQLATENAALIAEVAKLQSQQTRQALQQGRKRSFPALIAGIPSQKLEALLAPPGSATAAAVADAAAADADESCLATAPAHSASLIRRLSSVYPEGQEEDEQQGWNTADAAQEVASTGGPAWAHAHSNLQQRAQHLDIQIELTQLRAQCEVLQAEAAEAAAQALTKQGAIHTLQRQLSAADGLHEKEMKELRKAAKQSERRAEQLAQQLPSKKDDSSAQVQPCHPN